MACLAAVLPLCIAGHVAAQDVLPTGPYVSDDGQIEADAYGYPYQIPHIRFWLATVMFELAYDSVTGFYVNGVPATRRCSITEINGDYWYSLEHWDAATAQWVSDGIGEMLPQ